MVVSTPDPPETTIGPSEPSSRGHRLDGVRWTLCHTDGFENGWKHPSARSDQFDGGAPLESIPGAVQDISPGSVNTTVGSIIILPVLITH